MKYKSMQDLQNLSDEEVEDFLKRYWKTDDLTFYGVFEPNSENLDKFSGTMTKLKVPGSTMWLKYPFADDGYVALKIPANKRLEKKYYKFRCHLLPSNANRCQLQILLGTLEEIDKRTYFFIRQSHDGQEQQTDRTASPLTRRFELVEDKETGWGKDIKRLMGAYRKCKDGTYCLDDIRKADLTKLQTYPKTTFRVGPLTLSKPIEGLQEGDYCLFNWKFTFKERVNPCQIEVDESKPLTFITPREFITAIENAPWLPASADSHTDSQKDVCVLLHDLLHEANKYHGATVDVQFSLADNYLAFQHTGCGPTLFLPYAGKHKKGQNNKPMT